MQKELYIIIYTRVLYVVITCPLISSIYLPPYHHSSLPFHQTLFNPHPQFNSNKRKREYIKKKKMSTPQTRQTYRSLLRLIPRRRFTPISQNPNPNTPYKPTPLHTRLRTLYRTPSASEEIQQSRLQEAEQMATYATAQMKYAVLLERYNPGMSLDEQERIRLTARRVGLDLPVMNEEDGSGRKEE